MVTSPENPIDPRDNEQPDETAPMPTDTEPTIQSESASDPLDLFGSSERMATEPMPEHMAAEQTTTGQTEPMTTPTAATTPLPPMPAADSTYPTPTEPQAQWQAPQPAPAPAPASESKKRRPLFGTIVWGVLLLVFAAFMVVWTVVPTSPDPTLWLLGAVIATGILLVVAGIVAAARRAG